jgi:putative DNA primase/helicase
VTALGDAVPPVVMPAPSDPMAVARALAVDYHFDGFPTLRRWRGGWMTWQRTHWAENEDAEVRAWTYSKLEKAVYIDAEGDLVPWRPTRHKIANLAEALAAIAHLGEGVDPPAWLAASPLPDGEVVACANGLLHVGTRELIGLNPCFFNRVSVPFDYAPDAPPPVRWLQFLRELWPDDPDSIAALQEFVGYVLSGRTDLHKIALLIGPTRAGKGVIARVLSALVGAGNVAGPTLASLGTNFGLSPLLGKPLAVVSDARLGGANVHQVVERLLSISGEDMLTVDRKYKEPWTGKLSARFLLISNELPRFGDASGAIAGRFIVLVLSSSWLGRENPGLTHELIGELPGILNWALAGLDRLASVGRFTEPTSSADAILTLQDLVSPVAAFVRDRCTRGPGLEVPVADLFAVWKAWCEDNGHNRPGTVQTFGRDLRAVAPQVRRIQPRNGEDRVPSYVGIALGVEQSMARTAAHRGLENSELSLGRNGPQSSAMSADLNGRRSDADQPSPEDVARWRQMAQTEASQ